MIKLTALLSVLLLLMTASVTLSQKVDSIKVEQSGDWVSGGKPDNWIIWDVLKDIDEVKSLDFIISPELIRDMRPVTETGQVIKPVSWDKKKNEHHACYV